MLRTGTMQGLRLTSAATLAQCSCLSSTAVGKLERDDVCCRCGGGRQDPQWHMALQAWVQHLLSLPAGFPLPFASSKIVACR